jgi:alkanesulfonate monooxygenase SsuD/methylene tetrahydromethanopterin reductase-like flavin-dependent oxidoreductase (luciferase family)
MLVLAAAAAVTTRVQLGLGVLIVSLREPAWTGTQVATLQYLSGNRLILGVGVGGDRHDRSWAAAGVPKPERGRRLDAALGWFAYPMSAGDLRLAAARMSVPVTANLTVSITDDPTLPGRGAVLRRVTGPDGLFAIPEATAEEMLVFGDVELVADHLRAYGDAGAARVAVTFPAGDWHRQADLLASAIALAGDMRSDVP